LSEEKRLVKVGNMKNGNLVEFFGGSWEGIGVYGGENGFWTLLNRRKTPKKDELCAPFDHFCTVF